MIKDIHPKQPTNKGGTFLLISFQMLVTDEEMSSNNIIRYTDTEGIVFRLNIVFRLHIFAECVFNLFLY